MSQVSRSNSSLTTAVSDQPALTQADMQAVVRLLGEVAAMDTPTAARKSRLMEGLAELVDADAWMWVVTKLTAGEDPTAYETLHGGFDERRLAIYYQASYDPDDPPAEYPGLYELFKHGKPATRRRQQLVDDRTWYAHPQIERYRKPANLDQFLFSFYPLSEQTWSSIGLHREWGRSAFTARDARLVHIVLNEIPWLHAAGAPEEATLDVPMLPPRLRVVQGLLLDGWNRAGIAKHLGLTESTVRSYISEVYRRFNVKSQRKLIARFRVGDGGDVA